MRASSARQCLPLLLVLVACGGGGPDIVGLYMTTSHEAAEAACAGGTTPADSPPYFRIEKREILEVDYRTRSDCQDKTPASCSGGGGLLVEETADGFRGDAYLAIGDPTSCTLIHSTYEASLDGEELTFENRDYTETGAFNPCTTDQTEERAGDLPCVSYELIVGVRVEE